MTDTHIVKIHGKDYMTVAGRLQLAHDAATTLSITTEVLPIQDQIVVKATVVTDKGTFTGISAANPDKQIEKQSPYEVAETSAVGRALGFAGFGLLDGVASADEMDKSIGQESGKVYCSEEKCTNKQFPLPPEVVEFSMKSWRRPICYKCQQLYK